VAAEGEGFAHRKNTKLLSMVAYEYYELMERADGSEEY